MSPLKKHGEPHPHPTATRAPANPALPWWPWSSPSFWSLLALIFACKRPNLQLIHSQNSSEKEKRRERRERKWRKRRDSLAGNSFQAEGGAGRRQEYLGHYKKKIFQETVRIDLYIYSHPLTSLYVCIHANTWTHIPLTALPDLTQWPMTPQTQQLLAQTHIVSRLP